MASLDQLLVLQEHDTTAEQLRHRRLTLPQRDQLVAHEQELASVEQQTVTVQGQRDDVARTQKRLEDEVASVEAKVADVHAKLYGGSVTSPRELQALQDDESSLKRHQTNVEDKVLEQMELALPLDEQLASVQQQRDDVARSQKRLEDEVATVEAKVADVHGKLYGGSVTAPKELQALQDDETSLKRHQGNVEDKVLEQMELAVPLDDELEALAARRVELEQLAVRADQAITVAEAEIDAELAVVLAERDDIAAELDPESVATYEQLRHDLGGIAVARLVGTNCGGCHLTLSAVELDRVRHSPPDVMVFCGECGRLLVH